MDARHESSFPYGAAYSPATRSHDTPGTSESVRSSLSSIAAYLNTQRTPYSYSGGTADRLYRSTSHGSVDNVNPRSRRLRTGDPNAPSEEQEGVRRNVASESSRRSSPEITIIIESPPSSPASGASSVERTQFASARDSILYELDRQDARMHTAKDAGLAPPPRDVGTAPSRRRSAPAVGAPHGLTPWPYPPDAPSEERYRGPLVSSQDRPQRTAALAFSPDSKWVAHGSLDGNIFLRRTTDPSIAVAQRAVGFSVCALAFSPDGRQLASGHNGYVYVWSIGYGIGGWETQLNVQHIYELASQASVLAVSWYPDGTRIAICSDDIAVYTLQPGVKKVVHHGFGRHPRGTLAFARFSPDIALLAFNTPGIGSQCDIWNVQTGTKRATISGPDPPGTILNAQFDALGARIVICSSDRQVRVWTTAIWDELVEPEILRLTHHTGPALDASFSSDGKLLLTGTAEGILRCWRSLSEPGFSDKPAGWHDYCMTISSVGFSPDTKFAACASPDGYIYCGEVNPTWSCVDGGGKRWRRSHSAEARRRPLWENLKRIVGHR
ncbi:hypothetical protein VTO73DRAFT_11605 [Trametes versicolor]